MKINFMKKPLFVLAVAAMTQANQAMAQNEMPLSVNLQNTNDTVVVICMDMNTREAGSKDTLAVNKTSFSTTLRVKEPSYTYLLNMKNGKINSQVFFVAVPGEKCEITGDWNSSYYLNGSEFYKQYDAMDRSLEVFQNEKNALDKECREMLEKGMNRDSVISYFQSKAEEIDARMEKAQMDYVKANPKSEISAYLVSQLGTEKTDAAYKLLDASVRNGRMKSILKLALEQAAKEKEMKEKAKLVSEGKAAPDFTLKDINGKPLRLSSLRGKYVVLDFWGSWCGWCIKGFPEMKNYYNKYKGKLEILGIDCGDTETKWKEAVKKHALPWLHVYNPRGNGDITGKYAIQGYPTKIVVDPKGVIAKVVVGEDPAFYTYLDKLFK